jgi:hypothetical protein
MNDVPSGMWRPGTTCRTRDRRQARIRDCKGGLIQGEVEMHGPCIWLADGRWRDAPFGAAGPLDLLPPAQGEAAAGSPRRACVAEALQDGGRFICCD